MALAVGDVVVLKSGGPLMTVEFINEDKSVRCSWFDENKRVIGSFQPETLEKDDGEPVSGFIG